MNQRTILIIILAIVFAIIVYRSWRKVEIKKTSDENKTVINVEIKKEPVAK